MVKTSTPPETTPKPAVSVRSAERPKTEQDRQLVRWGGIAGVGGALLLVASAVVVGGLGLPDASSVETLQDFANIESGRIAEHFLYLGSLMLMALHALVLYRILSRFHPAAALFGAATAAFGFVIMAGSSLLHLSTSPLADLYTAPGVGPEGLLAIEYAWYGAQSVFDTMLATGVLLVPIGIVLFGLAMRKAAAFGDGMTALALGLGTLGIVGASLGIIIPGSMWSAVGVLTIAVFHLSVGWKTLAMAKEAVADPS